MVYKIDLTPIATNSLFIYFKKLTCQRLTGNTLDQTTPKTYHMTHIFPILMDLETFLPSKEGTISQFKASLPRPWLPLTLLCPQLPLYCDVSPITTNLLHSAMLPSTFLWLLHSIPIPALSPPIHPSIVKAVILGCIYTTSHPYTYITIMSWVPKAQEVTISFYHYIELSQTILQWG